LDITTSPFARHQVWVELPFVKTYQPYQSSVTIPRNFIIFVSYGNGLHGGANSY